MPNPGVNTRLIPTEVTFLVLWQLPCARMVQQKTEWGKVGGALLEVDDPPIKDKLKT